MLQLSDLLQAKGHTVIPFAMQQKETLQTPYNKYFVSEMELHDPHGVSFGKKIFSATRFIYSREARRNLEKLLQEHPIDIAHLHNIYHHISPSILFALKRRKIPVVMTLHDYSILSPSYTLFHHGAIHEEDARGWYTTCIKNKCVKNSTSASALATFEMILHHKIFRWYERHVDKFIAPSQWMIDLCVKHGWPREKFIHIPHPVEAQTDVWQDGVGVVYAGRLSEEKGLDVLLDAATQISDVPFIIVGTGPLEHHLRERVRAEKITNVRFTGFQTGAQLKQLLQHARLHVLPSVWYENYPLSILEAKAQAKIVVGSRIGGIPELLPQELLVEPGRSSDLAKTLKMWYTASSEKRRELGKKLQLESQKINDPGEHVASILGLYQGLR